MQKCLMCGDKFETKPDLFEHYEEDHSSEFDNKMTGAQMHFFKLHGRITGKCRICGKDTGWNTATNLPFALCKNPNCTKEYRSMFVKRMKKVYGKEHLLNDPEVQKKMLANRSISGVYTWSDGEKKQYVGTYELDFLRFLNKFYKFPSRDVMTPAPQIINYMYQGKAHFYIPDVFIPSLNLIIEIKDGGSNPNTHPKIMAVDKEKEKLKDQAIISSSYNYVKLTDKNYGAFVDFLLNVTDKDIPYGKINNISESLSPEHLSESIISNMQSKSFYDYLIIFDVTTAQGYKYGFYSPNKTDGIIVFNTPSDSLTLEVKKINVEDIDKLDRVDIWAMKKPNNGLSLYNVISNIKCKDLNVTDDTIVMQILNSYYDNEYASYVDLEHYLNTSLSTYQCFRGTFNEFLNNMNNISNDLLNNSIYNFNFNDLEPFKELDFINESAREELGLPPKNAKSSVIFNLNTNNKMNKGERSRGEAIVEEKISKKKLKEKKSEIKKKIRKNINNTKYSKLIENAYRESQLRILQNIIHEDSKLNHDDKVNLIELASIHEKEVGFINKGDMDITILPIKIEESITPIMLSKLDEDNNGLYKSYKELITEGTLQKDNTVQYLYAKRHLIESINKVENENPKLNNTLLKNYLGIGDM